MFEKDNWVITAKKAPMDNSNERDELEHSLKAPLLPEMVFTKSIVEFKYKPNGFSIQFLAKSALKEWVENSTEYVSVGCSKDWENGRKKHIADLEKKSFDWTFTNKYVGDITTSITNENNEVKEILIERTHEQIDLDMLRRPDPILFFGDVILFEDELADNGEAMLSVKLRVMPECFFCLQRFFLRVDDVLFKVIDVRLFHQFGKPYLLREVQEREASYDELRSHNVLPEDKTEYNNQNLMATVIPLKEKYVEKITFNP